MYFPQYVSGPVDYWLNTCERVQTNVDMYSDDFLQAFEKSLFFPACKESVEGKLKWKEWGDCSVSCGSGTQTKIVTSCVPNYAICHGIQILERTCNYGACPVGQWLWNNWSECSKSCEGGIRTRIARSCEPEDTICNDIPIQEESCNTLVCPDTPSSFLPARVPR